MRLLLVFFVIAVAVYVLTGIPKKFSRKKRFLFALGTYVTLYIILLLVIAFAGDVLH